MYLDELFYKSLRELINLPDKELKQKKQQARTLLLCLDSVIALKSSCATSTKPLGE